MPKRSSHKVGSELFIVDNSEDDWKALRYLHDWCQISKQIDIAAGFFEVGALLALDGEWQKVDHYRRVVTALTETREIMDDIDNAIEEHGGWPGAFAIGTDAEEGE